MVKLFNGGLDKVIMNIINDLFDIKKIDAFADISIRLQGRIVYIDAKAGGELTPGTARDLGNKSLEAFSAEEKAYYDIQYIINSDTNTTEYPVLGYKHHSKESINWTRDRAVN